MNACAEQLVPANDLFEKNMEALRRHRPELFATVKGHALTPVGELIDTAAGVPTLRLAAPDATHLLAYNDQDPWLDTDVHLQTVEPDSHGLAVFIGMGLGYGPLRVLRERPTVGMMLILEPSVDLFLTALGAVDLEPLVTSRKVRIVVGDIDFRALERTIARIASIEDTHILRHVPSFQWRRETYSSLNQQLFLLVNQLNATGGTTRKAGHRFFQNRLANLSLLRHSADLGLLDQAFAGKPAVLVAAGPSLDSSLEELKPLQGRCALIAADSALAPLVKAGIVPDFVTSIDYQDANFEKLAPFVDREWPFALVNTLKVTPLIPKRFRARRLFWALNEDLPQQWINRGLGSRELDLPATSVAHLSLGVALVLGCDPIIMVGQDLAYTQAGGDHASGTIIMQQGLPKDREIFYVKGIGGKPVPTDRLFLGLQKAFEDIIAATPRRYFNASAAGVQIKGTETASLAALEREFMVESFSVQKDLDALLGDQPTFPLTAFIKECHRVLGGVRKLSGQVQESRTLAATAQRGVKKLRGRHVPVRQFGELPQDLAKKLARFDGINKAIDEAEWLTSHILELTYQTLSENDRLRESNEGLQEKEGYLAWLAAEIERIDMVNRERQAAFAEYQTMLRHLVRHLEQEAKLAARLAARPTQEAVVELARLYRDMADYRLALDALEKAAASEAPSPAALLLAGEARAALLDLEGARRDWQAAAAGPKNSAAKAVEAQQLAAAFWIETAGKFGNIDGGQGNFPQLLPVWLRRAAQLLDGDQELPRSVKELWQRHAAQLEQLLAAGEMDQVGLLLRAWECFAELIPEFAVAKARHAAATGDRATAIASLQEVIGRSPDAPDWLAFLARMLFEEGRFEEGIARLQQAVALDPQAAGLWAELGDTLMEAGDWGGAIVAYEHCFVALPERLDMLAKMAECYLRQGQPAAAVAAYEALLAKAPEDIRAREGLKRAHRMGEAPAS